MEGKGYTKPQDWSDVLWKSIMTKNENEYYGLQDEDLIVWMRTAAFPNFRKLYRKIEPKQLKLFTNKAEFKLNITYSKSILLKFESLTHNDIFENIADYKVKQFSGTKSIILSQTSFLGGKNPFLGIAYIVVGCICIIVGIAFIIIHKKFGRL